MSDVPADVLRDILLRLPAASLLRFRVVCKEWRRVIDDRTFVRDYTNNHPFPNTLLIRNRTGTSLYSISLDSLNFAINGRLEIQATPIEQLNRRHVPGLHSLPVASCNGLILISCNFNFLMNWAMWNPLTGQCRELPQPCSDQLELVSCWFGYDSVAYDYKVVRIDKSVWRLPRRYKYRTHVYSLRYKSWILVEDRPKSYNLSQPGVFLNGAVHWLAQGWGNEQEMIIVFDLGSEEYGHLPLPPPRLPFNWRFKLEPCEVYLDALGGCLMLSYLNDNKSFDGWVMKDYGVQDSWVKLFSFEEQYILRVVESLRPVAYLKDNNQVFLQYHGGFLWFDVESNSVKKVLIDQLPDISSSQICPGSLFRLSHGGSATPRTTGVKRKRKSEMGDPRLIFCVRDIGSSTSRFKSFK